MFQIQNAIPPLILATNFVNCLSY